MPKKMFQIASALTFLVGIFFLFNYSIKKTEQKECIKWQRYAEQLPNFYYTQWQKDQCNIK